MPVTQTASCEERVLPNALRSDLRIQSFNDGWKFHYGDLDGAYLQCYDDADWELISLPHDYSITQEFTQRGEAQSAYLLGGIGWYRKSLYVPARWSSKRIVLRFDGIYMDATIYVNGAQVANHPYGYSPFLADVTESINTGAHNVIAIRVNHQTPSSRWYSGSGIYRSVDLVVTNTVCIATPGIVIRPMNIDAYTGKGPLCVEIAARIMNASASDADIRIAHEVQPMGSAPSIGAGHGAVHIPAGHARTVTVRTTLDSPELWDIDNPARYRVVSRVYCGDECIDTYETITGFRAIRFDPVAGFMLNGRSLKLQGVCLHHDHGALGARAYRDAIERQLDLLIAMGANSVRIAHNPASRDLIELADEKGVLLIEELFDGWHLPKNGNTYDYSRFFDELVPPYTALEGVAPHSTWARFDLENTIRRDVNSPSIIMWSIGNEIQEGTTGELADFSDRQADLVRWVADADNTRPVTRGDNRLKFGDPGAYQVMGQMIREASRNNIAAAVGLNYANSDQYAQVHRQYPDALLYGSETASAVNSRGVYNRWSDSGRTTDKQLTSYDASAVNWGATASEAWLPVAQHDCIAGTYVWTGFDYLGEPTPWNGIAPSRQGEWPSPKNSYFGVIDTAGFPKDSYYFYQSQWNRAVTTLHILPAWNSEVVCADSSGRVKVVVYSNAPVVRLYFTPAGASETILIGEKRFTQRTSEGGRFTYQIYQGDDASDVPHENLFLTWLVPYVPGTLHAEAFDVDGTRLRDTVGRSQVTTSGAPAALHAQTHQQVITANGVDLVYVEISVRDGEGNEVPYANNRVSCSVSGDGVLLATDNGAQADHTPFHAASRGAYHGKVLAIVQATKHAGVIDLHATAPGLLPARLRIETRLVANVDVDNPAELPSAQAPEVAYYVFARNYYLAQGSDIQLSRKAKVVFVDGTQTTAAITWDAGALNSNPQVGAYGISGQTDLGDHVSANVFVLPDISGVKAYAASTPVGIVPDIPSRLRVVAATGEVLETSIPVLWETFDLRLFDKVGRIEVRGSAQVLGRSYQASAVINVEPVSFSVGPSITSAAGITVDIDPDLHSGSLDVLKDGRKEAHASRHHDNGGIWSNRLAAMRGDTDVEITFTYDTQQRFGGFVVTFYDDGETARYPLDHTTTFYVKDTLGDDWREVETNETIGAVFGGSNRDYRYSLSEPVLATMVKLVARADSDPEQGIGVTCLAMTEVELCVAVTGD